MPTQKELEESADWIREWRRSLGLTQEDLAKRFGVHTNSVSGWERAKHLPTPGQMRRLEKFFVELEETGHRKYTPEQITAMLGRPCDLRKEDS